MKTKTLLYMALAAVMTTLAACSQDDDLQQDAAPEATPIEFEITDGGYGGDEATRAVEEGYYTKFEAGDECGLYIVNGSTLKAENVKLTASDENGELTWKTESPIDINHNVDYSCFLYYPYQQDMTGKFDVDKTAEDTDFFDNLISGWEVQPNQSKHVDYTASDLMTAKGTATYDGATLKLSFKLDHRMALAEIAAPVEVDFSAGNYTPCEMGETEDGKFHYRVIINPENVANDGGKNIKGQIGSKTFTIGSAKLRELKRGQYKTFKVSTYYVDYPPEGTIYHVYDYKGLMAWAEQGNGCSCKLEADITMPEPENGKTYNWTPADVTPNGIFDGNGHTITGLVVNNTAENYAGFIKYNYGTVKNLTLKEAKITGKYNTGGVVGYNNGGKIENCHVAEGCSVCGSDYVGGISGVTSGGSFTNCCFMGDYITGDKGSDIGGIVGGAYETTFTNCTYKNCDKGVGNMDIDPDGIKGVGDE